MKNAIIAGLLLCLIGCKEKEYRIEDQGNSKAYRNNTVFVSYENISSPKFDSLKKKYQTDTIFHGEKDELKRILLLRNWIRSVISINDFTNDYPGEGDPQGILDAALKGHGYHCGHFMAVQNAVMNAYGYVTRCVGSGPGVKGEADGHHGFNEIWLNDYHKWFLSDAKYNHHFEKNGIPLSALEVRDEYLKNKAADIVLVKGPDRVPIDSDGVADQKGKMQQVTRDGFAKWFTWLEWEKKSDHYSASPGFSSKLIMYQDDYFKNHTWIWDGKPHWAYNTDHVQYETSREAIEWTPNTILVKTILEPGQARITLSSFTPNLREYQMKDSSDQHWIKCDSAITVPLQKDRYELAFRAVNTAGVHGPENYALIVSK